MKVDERLVLRKLSELEEYASQIQDFRSISVDDYKSDWKSQRIIERTLQMMIETCVDIAGHIITDIHGQKIFHRRVAEQNEK
ncbi:HepT-like ribonuclease domain-containing protein [Desulfosarcina cetonica]|uniref:HepT-like ribonuclease domain-containing protein n=1 Tax=Desulfosarcina cetonica TaxID=90730 RepID=UPI003BEED936